MCIYMYHGSHVQFMIGTEDKVAEDSYTVEYKINLLSDVTHRHDGRVLLLHFQMNPIQLRLPASTVFRPSS